MNRLSLLEYFYVVAQAGSISKGAHALGITQPSVSKSVRDLEREMGLVLFNRHAKGVSLTLEGQELFSECEKLFKISDRIFSSDSLLETKKIRVGCEDFVASHVCRKELQALFREFAQSEIELVVAPTDDLYIKLQSREINFVLSFYRPRIKGVRVERLGQYKQILVSSKKRLAKSDSHTFIGQRQINTKQKRKLPTIQYLRDKGYAIDTHIASNSLLFTKNYLENFEGVSLLPESVVAAALKRKTLFHVIKDFHVLSTLKLSYNEDSPNRVLQFFKKEFGCISTT